MSDRAALFANVLEQPADDSARLVLADWLEENGEESLGRLLRAGVVAARYSFEEFIDDPTITLRSPSSPPSPSPANRRGGSRRWGSAPRRLRAATGRGTAPATA